jgi:hypothetical protein
LIAIVIGWRLQSQLQIWSDRLLVDSSTVIPTPHNPKVRRNNSPPNTNTREYIYGVRNKLGIKTEDISIQATK